MQLESGQHMFAYSLTNNNYANEQNVYISGIHIIHFILFRSTHSCISNMPASDRVLI